MDFTALSRHKRENDEGGRGKGGGRGSRGVIKLQ